MADIPHAGGLDSIRAVLADPYRFISTRCAQLGTDVFETSMLRYRAICMTGPEAARAFYESGTFQRAGAAPARLLKTLFGQGGVQGLDGARHAARKELFTSLLDAERVRALSASFASGWRELAAKWTASGDDVVLYDELRELLTHSVCAWAGVPLPEHQVRRRCQQLTALFDGAGAIGARHWRARRARAATQSWLEEIIGAIRARELHPPQGSAAHEVAWHMDVDHALLDRQTAAVELLNILRPTVAVAIYLTFVAHAMHEHPYWRRGLEAGDEHSVEMFIQEVRRYYPFFPAVVATAGEDVDWAGYRIPAGSHIVLDLYGTNHDPRAWDEPERFDPERFRARRDDRFSFIPQGGGDPHSHHRCPGEPVATELMRTTVAMLSNELDYELPKQDMRIDYTRLPALPHSGMTLRNMHSYA